MAQLKTLHLNAATQAKPPIATAPFALHAQPLQVGTDPELKGGWIEPPAARRIFPACWDEREAAFGGVYRWPLVVFGSTGPKIIPKINSWRVWAGFAVAGVIRDFWNCAFLASTTPGFWPFAS